MSNIANRKGIVRNLLSYKYQIVFAAMIVGALLFAFHNRFVQDDAFISFRYARNLAEGNGLVWNIGERIEGYTNFMWTVLMVPAFLMNMNPVVYCHILSLGSFVFSLVLCFLLADKVWGGRFAGLTASALLAVNYSYNCYATGGLETQFGTALILASLYTLCLAVERRTLLSSFVAGLIVAISLMTRMDSVLFIAPLCLLMLPGAKRHENFKNNLYCMLFFCATAALPVLIWMICRYEFYGFWLPNTFNIKTEGASLVRGGYYQTLFYVVYGLFAPMALWIWYSKSLLEESRDKRYVLLICVSFILWSVYLLRVGGGFMEFRLMMPSYALLAVLLSGFFVFAPVLKVVKWMLVLLLCVTSLAYGVMQPQFPCVQPFLKLKEQHTEWKGVATFLNEILQNSNDKIKIGVTCAGIIPFYTALPSLDLLGLNDRNVAVNGDRISPANNWLGNRPGHVRMATWEQVVESEVNLLLNTPWVYEGSRESLLAIGCKKLLEYWYWGDGFDSRRVSAAMVRYPFDKMHGQPLPRIVAWPMPNGNYLITVYLCDSMIVDRAIEKCDAVVIYE